MRKTHTIFLSTFMLFITSCSTLKDSLELGAGMGAATGAAATYSAYSSTGQTAAAGDVVLGAGVGLALGLLTSYITHRQVEDDRNSSMSQQIEMHFGDLPPSPFLVPKMNLKKGAR